MKSTRTTLIITFFKSCFFKLLVIDIILIALFRYYQPLCEPCLDFTNCPPCLSKEQYFIIYIGIAINVLLGSFCLIRKIKSKALKWWFSKLKKDGIIGFVANKKQNLHGFCPFVVTNLAVNSLEVEVFKVTIRPTTCSRLNGYNTVCPMCVAVEPGG